MTNLNFGDVAGQDVHGAVQYLKATVSAKVDALETKLREAHANFMFHRCPARHAFGNETADAKHLPYLKYDRVAAELAWRRTLDFLAKYLK